VHEGGAPYSADAEHNRRLFPGAPLAASAIQADGMRVHQELLKIFSY
jgi:hypothetical protein